jgi:hypothetical protein
MWNDHGKVGFPPSGRAELNVEKLGKFQGLDSAFFAVIRIHAARRLIAVKRCKDGVRANSFEM